MFMTKDELVKKTEYLVKYKGMFTDAEYAAKIVAIAEEYANQQLLQQTDVVGRSEQLSCVTCKFNTDFWGEDYPCANCCGFDKHQAT